MKKRVRRALNFFAFNLLFFALYLNFIHKDTTPPSEFVGSQNGSVYTGTVSMDNPDAKPETNTTVAAQQTVPVKKIIGTTQN